MNREDAQKAAKHGAIAALVMGGMTTLLTGIAIFTNSSGVLAVYNDPFMLIDIALIFVFALGIYKMYRTAAVAMFIYAVLDRVISFMDSGELSGIGISLVIIFFLGKAVIGTFTYHSIEKRENPDYKGSPKWMYFIGIPCLGIVGLLLVFGVLLSVGVMPDTSVLEKEAIPEYQINVLRDNQVIDQSESVEYFYSAGIFSILEDGNLFTDKRVISYLTNEYDELEIYNFNFEDIERIDLVEQGHDLADSIYQITGPEDDWLYLYLSTEQDGDKQFISALRQRIAKVH